MSIQIFLDKLKQGYSRFKPAFDDVGIEDTDDFNSLDTDLNNLLINGLEKSGAKPLHIKVILKAIKAFLNSSIII